MMTDLHYESSGSVLCRFTPPTAHSLVTRTRFTRFTFITSGGGYSKSVGYKRTFALVPVYLSGSFPTFIQYLQNRFLNH